MNLRKIDALVAEHVMGKEVVYTVWGALGDTKYFTSYDRYSSYTEAENALPDIDRYEEAEVLWIAGPPAYSSNIAAAWEVVEKLGFVELEWVETEYGKHIARVTCDSSGKTLWRDWVEADTAPLAICLAALKAKGVEVPSE